MYTFYHVDKISLLLTVQNIYYDPLKNYKLNAAHQKKKHLRLPIKVLGENQNFPPALKKKFQPRPESDENFRPHPVALLYLLGIRFNCLYQFPD